MKRLLSTCLVAVPAIACSSGGSGGAKPDLSSEDSKMYYAFGATIGQNLSRGPLAGITPDQVNDLTTGITDALAQKPLQIDLATYGPKVQQFMMSRQQQAMNNPANAAKAEEEKKKGEEYAAKAAGEPGAEKLPDGLVIKTITAGTGVSPGETDNVKVNYEGKLTDGTVFDASAKHGGPATFQLNRVIKCWTEGVGKMKVGGKAELVCPSAIAYGDMGHPPGIPGGATLVFTVELLEATKGPPPPPPGAMMGGRPMMGGPPGMRQMPPGGQIQVKPLASAPGGPGSAPAPTTPPPQPRK